MLLRAMPVFFWLSLALVTVLALMPGPAVPHALLFWDKAQHSLAFAVLAISGCLAFPNNLRCLCLGLITHGAVIEILQSALCRTRYGEVSDWLADGLGVLIGLWLYKKWIRYHA